MSQNHHPNNFQTSFSLKIRHIGFFQKNNTSVNDELVKMAKFLPQISMDISINYK